MGRKGRADPGSAPAAAGGGGGLSKKAQAKIDAAARRKKNALVKWTILLCVFAFFAYFAYKQIDDAFYKPDRDAAAKAALEATKKAMYAQQQKDQEKENAFREGINAYSIDNRMKGALKNRIQEAFRKHTSPSVPSPADDPDAYWKFMRERAIKAGWKPKPKAKKKKRRRKKASKN